MSELKLPDSLEAVSSRYQKQSFDIRRLNSENYYIVNYFDASCDKCVNHLSEIKKFIEKHSAVKNLQYIFIADGPSKVIVSNAVNKTQFPYTIYYEKDYMAFTKLNKISVSSQYTTMLINGNKNLILFGAVFDNEKAEKLYMQIVQQCHL